jgi:outer membrane protein, adhesin transport system
VDGKRMRKMVYGIAMIMAAVPAQSLSAVQAKEPVAPRPDAPGQLPAGAGKERETAGEAVWSIERLIRETISVNPQVLGKRAAYRAARNAVTASRLNFLPSPYLQLQATGGERLGTSYRRYAACGVQLPVGLGGQKIAGLSMAKSMALSGSHSVQETRLSLAHGVVSAYQNLLALHHRMRALEKGVRLTEQYAAMMERRVRAGASAPIDKVQVDARLSQARNELSACRSGYRVATEQLSQLVGEPLQDERFLFLEAEGMEPPPGMETVLRQAEASNPTLARMAADITTAKAQRRLQTAELFPTLTLKAEHREYKDLIGSTAHDNLVYATVEYAFGSGISSFAGIRAASDRIDSYAEAREAALRDLRVRVRADHEECRLSLERYGEASSASLAAGRVLDSYTRLFVAGKRSWLDVLNAARELIQSEVAESDILATYWGSRYRLRLDAMDSALVDADPSTMPVSGASRAVSPASAPAWPESSPGYPFGELPP